MLLFRNSGIQIQYFVGSLNNYKIHFNEIQAQEVIHLKHFKVVLTRSHPHHLFCLYNFKRYDFQTNVTFLVLY